MRCREHGGHRQGPEEYLLDRLGAVQLGYTCEWCIRIVPNQAIRVGHFSVQINSEF